ncbi:hypothetical protein SDC9_77317 [bioreactor metagenome]|uniref:Uncharacterized protein n=1 Tax=bioreactor metagenome TaxID=1076179 RepID=A0A644YR47_9ZZZZ
MRQADGEKERVSTRGDLASEVKKKYSEGWCSNNELREVSRGHSTRKKMGRAEQS